MCCLYQVKFIIEDTMQKNIIINMNMDVILLRTLCHMIIMLQKVDPHAERGTGILIKESSIKVIEACRDSGKY
jgi:hypothetical protein